MKRKNLLKSLLVAVGLLVGSNAWGYDLPTGMEVKNVFAGTLNTDGTVSVENYESMTNLISWTKDGIKPVNSVALGSVDEVTNVNIGETLESGVVPTYVSGKVMHAYLRQGNSTGNCYAKFPFDAVSSGQLVFNADFWMSGNTNGPILIKFVDQDDNTVLEMNWNNGSGVRAFNYSNVKEDATTEIKATGNLCTYRTYKGFGIRDLVIDFTSGQVEFTLDYIDRNAKRSQTKVTTNIGTGKNIASLQVGKTAISSTDLYIDVDNLSLFTVGAESSAFNYTIKAMAGSTELATISSGVCKTDMNYSVTGLPKVIEKNGKYYILDDTTVSGYAKSFTMGSTDEEQVINYKEDANIVYFGEVENLNNAVYPVEGSFSGGYVAAINGSKTAQLTNLDKGFYLVSGYANDHAFRGMVLRSATTSENENVLAYITTATNNIMSDGFAVLSDDTPIYLSGITQTNGKINQSADLDYVLIKKINSLTIVGDFSENAWNIDEGIAMTQDATNPAVWTAVVDNFEVTSSKMSFEYKALANGNWDDLSFGKDVNTNQEYSFDYDGARAGTYKLTFTANTTDKKVELAIEKKDLSTYTVVGAYYNGTNQYSSFFDPSGTNIWDKEATANDLINNGDGTYSKIYWNVGLTEPGTIYYKVVKNHDWTENWGMSDKQDGNAEYIVNEAGTYNIKFTFNPTTAFSDGYNVKCEVIPYTVKKHIGKYNDKCYATYCSPYALDFSTLTNLVAYNATISGDNVSFNTESETASGEGMLLMATDEGDYDIPTTFDVAPNIDNALIGVLSETVIDEVGIFVLMNGGQGIGFYKTQKAFTVGANTAYLPKVSTAREFIGFGDDTTTSINAISNEKMNGEVYNLNGQRVVAPAKGLYIVNGKKVVLK